MVTRRFEVFKNPNPRSAKEIPFVVVLQTELLEELPTRIVAPLVRAGAIGTAVSRLNPGFKIDGIPVWMLTQQLAAVPVALLKNRITTLERDRDSIVSAIDLLFSGF